MDSCENIAMPQEAYALTEKLLLPSRMLLLGISYGPIRKPLKKARLSTLPEKPADVGYAGLKLRIHPWNKVVEQIILFGCLETCSYRTRLRTRANTVPELSPEGISS